LPLVTAVKVTVTVTALTAPAITAMESSQRAGIQLRRWSPGQRLSPGRAGRTKHFSDQYDPIRTHRTTFSSCTLKIAIFVTLIPSKLPEVKF
jgi:hypothetical protein